MKYCLITFRSITPAQRGESVLHKVGIDCAVMRTPKWMEEQGCGYSLRVKSQDIQRSIMILKNNNISFKKVYWQRDNGTVEEMEQ